ncbi:hypothetical protein DOY81_014177 [Sarcophaga bullata]|nr:hypothetical protein DOY81_014177 [Sarcophaga bullata]
MQSKVRVLGQYEMFGRRAENMEIIGTYAQLNWVMVRICVA